MGGKPRLVKLRPAVQRFAEAMELKLRKHDEDRGYDGWGGEDVEWLRKRAEEELQEAKDAILDPYQAIHEGLGHSLSRSERAQAAGEFVDAANFCMMAYDVLGGSR